MSTAITMIRLRWALTWAALRKSVWQTVAYVISLVFVVTTVFSAGVFAWNVGGAFHDVTPAEWVGPLYDADGLIRALVVLIGSFAVVLVALVQLMMLGEGSTMSSRKFALYGIGDLRLQFGLLASGLSGLPAIAGVLCLGLWALAYRPMGAAAVAGAVVAAPLAVIVMMSFSKMVIALASTLVLSKRGKSAFYIVSVITFVVLCQLPSLLLNNTGDEAMGGDLGVDVVIAQVGPAATVLGWTPFGAAFQLPFDAMVGAWGLVAARVAILAAAAVACFLVCTWCLKRERLTAGATGPAVKTKGIGAFGWMPDSPSGAVSARLLTYLKRDPRQSITFIMPVFFVVIFAFQSHGISLVIWQALIWSGWILSIVESNGLAYDGRGLTMEVIAGVRGRTDRMGRVRVYTAIIVGYLLVLAVGIAIYTGDWARPADLVAGLICTAVGLAVGLGGLGLAEIVSCVLMYPVPSMDKPFSSPQGRAMAQGFFPFVYMLGSVLALLPTGIVALVLLLAGAWAFNWVLIPVALANGVIMLAAGTWLGGKLMDARMLSIVRTLDSFASLQK